MNKESRSGVMWRFGASLIAVAMLALPATVRAQMFGGDWTRELERDRPRALSKAELRVEKEIRGLQAELRSAAAARDFARIRALYADDYTMTHGGGMVDDAEGRAKWVARGVSFSFETMDAAHQSLRVLGSSAAVAIINSRYAFPDGRTGTIRYMIVYEKGPGAGGYHGWRQRTALVNNIPDPAAPASGASSSSR